MRATRAHPFLLSATCVAALSFSTPAQAQSAGDLDTTFGDGGVARADFSGAAYQEYPAAALDPLGRIVVAGSAGTNVGPGFLIVVRYGEDGSLDASFGTDGWATGEHLDFHTEAMAVAVDGQGRIVVAGLANLWYREGADLLLARYDSQGQLDPTFGQGGMVIGDLGGHESATAVLLDAQDRVVVAGVRTWFTGTQWTGGGFVARYDDQGQLDSTFNASGYAIHDLGWNGWPRSIPADVALAPDGSLVVSGTTFGGYSPGTREDVALLRYKENGTLDADFGSGGLVTLDLSGYSDRPQALAVDSHNRIVVATTNRLVRFEAGGALDATFDGDGIVESPGPLADLALEVDDTIVAAGGYYSSYPRSYDFYIARYDVQGSLSAEITTDFASANNQASAVAIDASGRIVAAGTAYAYRHDDLALTRYKNDALDPTFGTDGRVTTEVQGSTWDEPRDLVTLQADGKIVVVGSSWDAANEEVAVARFLEDGQLDPGFGDAGELRTAFGRLWAAAYAVAVDEQGNILVAGELATEVRYNSDSGVARLLPNGDLDPSFGAGGVATTDMSAADRWDVAQALAIDSQGRIITVGYSPPNATLARYDESGQLDDGFGSGGLVVLNLGYSRHTLEDVAIAEGDSIVVAGTVGSQDCLLARFDVSGNLEWFEVLDFGLGLRDSTVGVALDPEGRIVIAAQTFSGWATTGWDLGLARYSLAGVLDLDFGQQGLVVTDMYSSGDSPSDLAIDAEGRIVVTGFVRRETTDSDFTLLRFTSAGELDGDFSSGGKVFTDVASVLGSSGPATEDRAYAVTIDARGRILVVGESWDNEDRAGADYAVVRYAGVTTPDWTLEALVVEVQGLVPDVLNHGQANSLLAKLQAAIQQSDAGNFGPTVQQLDAFILEVGALWNGGILPLSEAQDLDSAALAIRALYL